MRGTFGWRLWALPLGLAWPLSQAVAAVQAPPSVTLPAPSALIQPRGPGPYHQVVVPLAWQALSQRDDLGDLRILNAQGQNLPYAWLDSPASPRSNKPRACPCSDGVSLSHLSGLHRRHHLRGRCG